MQNHNHLIAIMQPTFLPWIGYLAMIDRVDEFVFLDNVQFDRRSWQQRNQIKTANGPSWITVPVQSKGLREQLIMDVLVNYEGDKNPLEKIGETIRHAYGKTPYYKKYESEFMEILAKNLDRLQDLNVQLIEWLCEKIGIKRNFKFASSLDAAGAKADLLAGICAICHADSYLSPPGSQPYLEESDAFSQKGIPVLYHTYNHPEYGQNGKDFLPYMSTIDLLFNQGPSSLEIIRSGVVQ